MGPMSRVEVTFRSSICHVVLIFPPVDSPPYHMSKPDDNTTLLKPLCVNKHTCVSNALDMIDVIIVMEKMWTIDS